MLLKEKLPRSDWWHDTNWADPEYAAEYVSEHRGWWKRDELPLVFLRAIWDSWELQHNLKDFITARRAMKKAKSGEDRVSLGRAADALCSPERVRKLAAKISRQFKRANPDI